MQPSTVFLPSRRTGLIVHGVATLVLLGGSGGCFWLSLNQQVGAYFVLFLLAAILLGIPLLLVIYRGGSLLSASYTLEREGLRLRWGLRAEDIPLPDIEWIRPASDLVNELPLPRLSWPGACTGIRTVPDLGIVEYMAADVDNMLLVATPQRVFVISPAEPLDFIHAFQRCAELGSLAPLPAHSARPAAFLQTVWNDGLARRLILAGFGLGLAFFVFVSLSIPTRTVISLGFNTDGRPVEPVPAAQLLLLPVLCALAFGADLIGGLIFYRLENRQRLAYMLWGSSLFTPILLFVAVLFIL